MVKLAPNTYFLNHKIFFQLKDDKLYLKLADDKEFQLHNVLSNWQLMPSKRLKACYLILFLARIVFKKNMNIGDLA